MKLMKPQVCYAAELTVLAPFAVLVVAMGCEVPLPGSAASVQFISALISAWPASRRIYERKKLPENQMRVLFPSFACLELHFQALQFVIDPLAPDGACIGDDNGETGHGKKQRETA